MANHGEPIHGMTPGPAGGWVPGPVGGTESDFNAVRRWDAMREVGSTGIQRTGTWRASVEYDWQPQLRSPLDAMKTFREIATNETMAFSALNVIDLLLRQVEWRVEPYAPNRKGSATVTPAADTKRFEDQARFLEECMHDLDVPWSSFVSECLTMLPYGFALLEMVFKRRRGANKKPKLASDHDDGLIGWARFAPRAQWTLYQWIYDDDGELVAARQIAPPDSVERVIPISKCIHLRTRVQYNSPYGVSVLRGAWIPAFYLRRLREIEGIAVERDLTGMPIARVPSEILDDQNATPGSLATRRAIQAMIQNVRRDAHEGILFPLEYDDNGNRTYEFELMASGGSRQAYISEIITRYEQRLVTSMLTEFLMLGQGEGAGGSYALSSDKTTLFGVALKTYLNVIADQINDVAIPKLWRLNGWDPAERPKLVPSNVAERDYLAVFTAIAQAAASGAPVWPNPDLWVHMLKLANLPEPSEDVMAMQEQATELNRIQQLQAVGLDLNGEPLQDDVEEEPTELEPGDEDDDPNVQVPDEQAAA